jgi:hypothetical protein
VLEGDNRFVIAIKKAIGPVGAARDAGTTGSGPVGWESDPGNVFTVKRQIDGISISAG